MTEALGAAGAACIVVNKNSNNPDWVCFSGLSERFRSDYVDHFAPLDPFLPHLNVAGRWIKLSDCLPQSLLRQSEWYNDFVLACGVRDILGTRLIETPSHLVYVGVHQQIGQSLGADVEPAMKELTSPLRSAMLRQTGASVSPIQAESESKRTPNKILLPRQQWWPILGRDGRGVLLARGSDRARLSSRGGTDERRGLERLCHNRDGRRRRHGRAIAGVKSPALPPVNMGKTPSRQNSIACSFSGRPSRARHLAHSPGRGHRRSSARELIFSRREDFLGDATARGSTPLSAYRGDRRQ